MDGDSGHQKQDIILDVSDLKCSVTLGNRTTTSTQQCSFRISTLFLPQIAHGTELQKMSLCPKCYSHFVIDVSEPQSYLLSLSRSGNRVERRKRCSYCSVSHWRQINLAEGTWSGSLDWVLTKPYWGNY